MGGIERVTDTLARYLIKSGYNVVFMSVEHTCDTEYDCVAPQYFTQPSGNEQFILEIIRKHDISIIINQMSLFNYCRKSSLPAHVKVITVMHDSYYAMYPHLRLNLLRKWNWRRVITKIMKGVYDQSDKVVLFVSPFKDEYRFFCPYAKDEKFAIIPNFNTFDTPAIAQKKKKLLWVGRHNEWHKRVTDILRIWSKLENRFPEWSIDILGEGPDSQKVHKLHKSLGLKRCYIRGTQNPEEYYQRSSFICMTSAFESFGMVLTEGMQHGCIPIAYDSYTAVRYIIDDGHDGVLIQPFDTDEYAKQLARLMSDENERTRMSAAAAQSVRQYDASTVLPKWIKLIRDYSN